MEEFEGEEEEDEEQDENAKTDAEDFLLKWSGNDTDLR